MKKKEIYGIMIFLGVCITLIQPAMGQPIPIIIEQSPSSGTSISSPLSTPSRLSTPPGPSSTPRLSTPPSPSSTPRLSTPRSPSSTFPLSTPSSPSSTPLLSTPSSPSSTPPLSTPPSPSSTSRPAADTLVPLGLCLENYAYPYPVKYITVNAQGQALRMAYMDVKPAQPNGHSILLLHGKNFCGAYWGQTAAALAEKGFRVIIPDQIGFGKSSKPSTLQYTFQLLAGNTKALLDSLQINKIIVLGHSMGGMVATRFTLMYPGTVEKFILEDPIGLEDWKLKVPYRTVDDWYGSELRQNYASQKKYQMESYFHGTWSPAYDKWLNIAAGWTLSPDYPRIAWNSALTYDMIFTQPVCYEFGNIQAPTLLIIGQLDRTALGKDKVPDSVRQTMGNYPVLGKQTHEKIRNSRLVELPGIGHVPHIESFELFIRPLLDFLHE